MHLLKRQQAERKVKNITGFLREAIKKNYANPEFAIEELKKQTGAPTKISEGKRQRVAVQKAELTKARNAKMHQLCEQIVQETPVLLEEATALILREHPLVRKACQPEKGLVESYYKKPMLRAMVDQYLLDHYPERFISIRERYDTQLATIEQKMGAGSRVSV